MSEPQVKPKPRLPDNWPTVPEPFGDEYLPMPLPFGQLVRSQANSPCGDCGQPILDMIAFVRTVKDPTTHEIKFNQETSVQCRECCRTPIDAIVVGQFDTDMLEYTLYDLVPQRIS